MQKGLLCFVYRFQYADSTNGGISSTCRDIVLVDSETTKDMIEGPFSDKDEKVLYLHYREKYDDYIAVPHDYGKGKHYMFGGNFLYTSDSRFPLKYPVKIFDRTE